MKTQSKVRAFTLIESLAVIATVGILSAILVPVVGEVRETTRLSKCRSNVRQIGLSLIASANQTPNLLFPANNSGGAWAWDVSHAVVQDIVSQAGREVLYCSSSSMVKNYSIEQLYNFRPGVFAVTSYVLLIPGTKQVQNGWTAANPVPDYLSERLQATYNTQNYVVPANQRALVVDAIVSTGTNFTNVSGGLASTASNHLSGTLPAGGHAAFVDGHVEWRPFQRAATASQAADPNYFSPKGTGSPTFWF
jgi:prepilin-type processing-associated H-X9-DG protein